jgi:hypothetical protein
LLMKFFVYLHKRQTDGIVFYVGKGCRYRHKSKWNRSAHWHSTVNKHGYTIEIVKNGLTEKEAFELEISLIEKYKSDKLCNRTLGGEGASGCLVSEETKQKHKTLRNSKEFRENLSKKAKQRFANPEFRKKHSETIRRVFSNPDLKKRISEKVTAYVSKPEVRERARNITLKYFSNPEAREKASLLAKKRFDSPEKREKHAQAKALICIETGMKFGTTTLASEWIRSLGQYKGDNSLIAKACRGGCPSAYGYTWRYLTPEEAMEVLG